jgi:hypothetical protein
MLDKNRDQTGSFRGISGTLRREGWRDYCDYSDVFYVVTPACVG